MPIDEETFRVLRALNGRHYFAQAFDAYRMCGGQLDSSAFRYRAERGLELLASSPRVRKRRLAFRLRQATGR